MNLNLRPKEECQFDAVSLGEVMLRLDPGEGRIRTARNFRAWEGGGEYNVVRGLRRCFGMKTAVITAFADNEVGKLMEDFILQGGVDTSLINWKKTDGIGRICRNGINFTERGFGIRGAVGCSDRANTAIAQATPEDFDFDYIFGELGVRWLHTGGIYAALSEQSCETVLAAIKAAKKYGTIVSYDLNYRPSMWSAIGGQEKAQEVNKEIAKYVDVMIGKKRDGQIGGNDEREQTLNQLLTEMDGFEDNTGVIILAATNRPESLDPALLRPGRFDRRVPVELPDLKGREDILKVHAKKIKVGDNVDYNKVARMASGASGAELANIVNEAALRAVRDNRKFVTQEDLEESIEVVIAGYQKKNAILTDKEKRIVAYHEIGHALVAAKQTNSAPVQKITIVPRTSGALGYTMQVEEGNHYLMTKEEILNKIETLTGGRAAEEIVFGSVTTGASNDIEQATKLARAMITRYGMTCDFDMVAMEVQTNQYLGGDSSLTCSTETQTKIDEKVVEVVRSEHEKAAGILMENREKLDDLARYLYEKETITGEEFMNILNA